MGIRLERIDDEPLAGELAVVFDLAADEPDLDEDDLPGLVVGSTLNGMY